MTFADALYIGATHIKTSIQILLRLAMAFPLFVVVHFYQYSPHYATMRRSIA